MLANTLLIFVLQILAVSAFTKIPRPKLRTFNWNIGWVNAAPNGFERPFVGINGQWPCPALDLNVGDTIKINAYNGLGNESTAIHFHGIFQHNTAEMDGPAMVTQCPIAPGMSESSRILGSW
jgi:iron transport multicopper oxidase